MKKPHYILFLIAFLLSACSTTTYVSKKKLLKILPQNVQSLSLEDCNKILDFYTSGNITNQIFNNGPINQKVMIKALLLNEISIKAMSRKEVIEKRLDKTEYYNILNLYLKDFTSLTYNGKTNQIEEADPKFTKGYSFKIHFENISDPYEPIFLEDGYSYFFLENMKGEFSRVTNVSGLFVEDYFQLDGYLDAVITFSPFSNDGTRIFEQKDLNESYKLVFNGLQNEPIIVKWILKE